MMKLVWTKQMSVGNAVIDSDHKNLIAIINGTERAIGARNPSVISQAFEFLEGWLCVHFANDKRIARAANIDFLEYKQAQQYSLKELQHLRDELVARKGILSESETKHYFHLLRRWITEHIIKVDMPMKPMLQTLDYLFWPGYGRGDTNHAAGYTANLYLQHADTPEPCHA